MIAFLPFALAFLFSLAGRVSAFTFNVTIGGNQTFAKDILPPGDISALNCTTQCSSVQNTFNTANDDAATLCRDDIVDAFIGCEQCLFNQIVADNSPPSPQAGSNVVVGGYAAACGLFNFTLAVNRTKLAIAPNWDGPFGQKHFDPIKHVNGIHVTVPQSWFGTDTSFDG
ncbi:hypothetical protein D9758_007895 [Tetrapyrgos nigripes]|uniref:Uncharacterized protein n=1 Tax=Tetrapyrgos nigripes TaxID=182062 RepID=A0A8H5D3I9_9AGAR|nr:hypothetical protein D9758_007895 [Tetrapyrgos nigripes]